MDKAIRLCLLISIVQVGLSLGYLTYMLVGEVNFSTATTGPVVLWTGVFFLAQCLLFSLNTATFIYAWRKDSLETKKVAKYFIGGIVLALSIAVLALWLGEQRVQQSKQLTSASQGA